MIATMAPEHLFVYGTLKRGNSRGNMLQGLEFLREARITGSLFMIHYGGFPAVVLENEGEVFGEVYRIEEEYRDNLIKYLDMIEGHPRLFTREIINVEADDEIIPCYIYTAGPSLENYLTNRIESGVF